MVATGDEARLRGKSQKISVIRPEGACLFPALADAHIHLWGLGLRAGSVDLRGRKVADIYDALSATPPSPSGWVFGTNWDDNLFDEGTALSIEELDRMFGGVPVVLRRVDGHALWVNTAALEQAKIIADFDPGPGGYAERDARGRFTGRLVDKAMDAILATIPETSEAEDEAVFRQCASRLRQMGITCAHMAWTSVERVAMLERLAASEALPIRVYTLVDGDDPRLGEVLEGGPRHDPRGMCSIRGIKFFDDGAMGSRGAWTLEPYLGGGHGLAMKNPGELLERTVELMGAGWQVAVHAIGDAAAREVLDAFAAVPADVRRALRPRLEHAQMVTDEDIERFASLSAIASIQPIHMRSDAPWARTIIAPDQVPRLFPWRRLIACTTLCGGSDFPIDDPNPWHGIATAMSRRDASGEIFRAQDALTSHEALAAYTTGAAFAAHWEDHLGQLRPGFCADYIALDRDPFEVDADQMWAMEVLDTVLGTSFA